MKPDHILIVEDEEDVSSVLSEYLINEGFKTSCLADGNAVLPFVKQKSLSLILLDILLPGMNGIEICKAIKTFSNIPIIMLTAKVDEIDRIIGLEIGADDYVCKPFSPREVVARVKAVLRRFRTNAEVNDEQAQKKIYLNLSSFQLVIYDKPIDLTPTECAIIELMLSKPGHVFSRSQMTQILKKCVANSQTRTIDFHIKNLRQKISEHLPEERVVQSVYGAGYKIVL
jgi:two-component system response regulator BaeR